MNNTLFSRMVEKKTNSHLFNETLYKGKKVGNKIYKISRLELKTMENKKAREIFGENSKLEILTDSFLINELKTIYERYKDDPRPFETAMSISKTNALKFQQINKKQIKISRIIKYVTIRKNFKMISDVIIAPSNGSSFYDIMSWVELWVYKDIKNRFIIIPINATNHIFSKLNGKNIISPISKKLNEQLTIHNINSETKPVLKISKGDVLLSDDNKQYFICGYSKSNNSLEVKPLKHVSMTKKRVYKPINNIKGYILIKSNILGTKQKNIFTF